MPWRFQYAFPTKGTSSQYTAQPLWKLALVSCPMQGLPTIPITPFSQQKGPVQNHMGISCHVLLGIFSLAQLLIVSLIFMSLTFLKFTVPTCTDAPQCWFDLMFPHDQRQAGTVHLGQEYCRSDAGFFSRHLTVWCMISIRPSPGDTRLDPWSRGVSARFLINSDSVPFHKQFVETIETMYIFQSSADFQLSHLFISEQINGFLFCSVC